MQIDESRMFVFRFPYESTELAIPVRANSREEAGEKLQKVLSGIQTDLAMEFPKVHPTIASIVSSPSLNGEMPALVQELKIETLMKDMGFTGITDIEKATTIKKWTGLDYMPNNFNAILAALEHLKNPPPADEKKGKNKS